MVSRRFPINQSEKVRPIDDFSQSQVNSTVTTYEEATVDGPDVICALAVKLMKGLRDNGRSSQLVGRALDLASAYRLNSFLNMVICQYVCISMFFNVNMGTCFNV